ncbi:hypothetical protein TWF506_009722 [Arthrobotrys conoides]|uniref:F-box domain-containing protein n=1 Tax=Arthrobotrys conoides TaxID=74498 RepID=A0AAN8N7D0_9PEZI
MSTKASLQELPPETITNILEYLKLQKRALARVARVSRKLNALASPLLYETVVLDLRSFRRSEGMKYTSLLVDGHQSFRLIKNFGFKGIVDEPGTVHPESSETLDWIVLGLLRHLKNGQLRNFIWLTDLDLTGAIARELKYRQSLLQGIWVSSGSKYPSVVDYSLFWTTLDRIQHLHLSEVCFKPELWRMFRDPDRTLNTLQSLTVTVPDSYDLQGTVTMLQDPNFDGSILPIEEPPLWAPPKFPSLKYLSLGGVGMGLLKTPTKINQIFDVDKLRTLKLIDSMDLWTTLNDLQKLSLRLKTFHLRTKDPHISIENFLSSFSGLEELYLDLEGSQVNDIKNNLGLKNHSSTLIRLFIRLEREEEEQENFGIFFTEFAESRMCFPQLLELAIACSPKSIEHFHDSYYDLMPKLQLLWLPIVVHNWTVDDLRQDHITSLLRPIFRDWLMTDGMKLSFVAIGTRDRGGWPFIFELCQADSISGYISTSLGYISHQRLFNHNPDLTLLNIETIWLPWQEERQFIDSIPESHFYDFWRFDDPLFTNPEIEWLN